MHVDNLCNGVAKSIDAMRKLKYTLDRKTLETIYCSFVRPKLEYGSVIWHDCHKNDSEALEKIQLDAARIVTGAKRGTSHVKLYTECMWQTLFSRREKSQLSLFYKMVNGETPSYLSDLVPPLVGQNVHLINLRNDSKFRTI